MTNKANKKDESYYEQKFIKSIQIFGLVTLVSLSVYIFSIHEFIAVLAIAISFWHTMYRFLANVKLKETLALKFFASIPSIIFIIDYVVYYTTGFSLFII